MNTLNELLADGALSAVSFSTDGGGSSRSTKTFVNELATALSATPKKPLIVVTDNALVAIFRAFGGAELRSKYGRDLRINLRFADIEISYRGRVHIETQWDAVGSSSNSTLTLPEDGKWLDGRTPLTVTRTELPVWSTTAVSSAIEALLERWEAAGRLVAPGQPAPTVRTPSAVEPAYDTDGPSKPARTDRFTAGEREALELMGLDEPAAVEKPPSKWANILGLGGRR
jgi:hypothetical protein